MRSSERKIAFRLAPGLSAAILLWNAVSNDLFELRSRHRLDAPSQLVLQIRETLNQCTSIIMR
jgi:hypothetical protein